MKTSILKKATCTWGWLVESGKNKMIFYVLFVNDMCSSVLLLLCGYDSVSGGKLKAEAKVKALPARLPAGVTMLTCLQLKIFVLAQIVTLHDSKCSFLIFHPGINWFIFIASFSAAKL